MGTTEPMSGDTSEPPLSTRTNDARVTLVSPATAVTAVVTLVGATAGVAVEFIARNELGSAFTVVLWCAVGLFLLASAQAARSRVICSSHVLTWRSVYGRNSEVELSKVDRFLYAGFKGGMQVQLTSGKRIRIQEYAGWRKHAEMGVTRLNEFLAAHR
jgi:hypothetical protein